MPPTAQLAMRPDASRTSSRRALALACAVAFIALLTCAIAAPTPYAHAATAPTAAAKDVEGGSWTTAKKCMYYKNANGAKVKGLARIGKKVYYFDSKGVQRVGWRKVGDTYCFFTIANGAKGSLVTSKVVNGIKLKADGSAKVNKIAKQELDLMVAAQKRCDAQTKPLDSVSVKEKKLFRWVWKKCRERSSWKWHNSKGWHRKYAWDILKRHAGSCDSMGCGYAYLANAAGGKDVKIAASGGHTWTVVDGKVCDPEQAKQGRGWHVYKNKGLYGRAGRYKVTISPRTTEWSKAKASDSSSKKKKSKKTGWQKKNGKRYYYKKGKLQKKTWITVKNKRYYATGSGAVATGSVKVKGTYYVFSTSGVLQQGKKTRTVKVAGATYRVDKKGRARGGWVDKKTRYFAQNGELMTGVRWFDGKLWAFSNGGTYNARLTTQLRSLYKPNTDATELLKALGSPKSRKVAGSCRPGYEGGEEVSYTFAHIKLYTYHAAGKPELANYIEKA